MKGKRHRDKTARRFIFYDGAALRLAAALCLAALSAFAVGCGKTEDSSISTATVSVTQAEAAQQTAKKKTTSPEAEPEESDTASKTTKKSADSKESDAAKTTKKSSSSDTSKSSQQTTEASPSQSQAVTSEKNAEPANATATSKVTSGSTKTTTKKTTTTAKSDDPAQEYHIYADGYVTKYDELKLKSLTKEQREAYNALSEGIWKMQKEIRIPSGIIKQSEASDFLYTVLGTMPEVNYVNGTFKVSVSGGYVKKYIITYSLDSEEASNEHRKLRAAASKIVGSLAPGMSDYEKVKYFHDYIIKNCEYDTDSSAKGHGNSYTAYGCLVEGRAVCEGYAMALDYLCEKAGIYSLLISGESTNSSSQTVSHIWNKIQLDGKWYNVDATWDDPVSTLGEDYVRYDYFCITDAELSYSHKVEKNIFGYYPEANDTAYNYFIKNGLYIESFDNADDILIHAFELALNENSRNVSVRCADEELLAQVSSRLLSSDEATGLHRVYGYLLAAGERTGKEIVYNGYYLVKNERLGVIALVIK